MLAENLAPVVLFVYNRAEHTQRCLESLKANELAASTRLYIYCDGPKEQASQAERDRITAVREIVRKEQWCGEVIIETQETNRGLRSSVIAGVTAVVNQYGKVIVIEDDLVLSRYFLSYMNQALSRYESASEVAQVSAYAFPANTASLDTDAYFMPLSTTWGWGTWARVWNAVDFNTTDFTLLSDPQQKRAFNLDNAYDYYNMLMDQTGERVPISSWGILFWWHVFKNRSLVLYPKHTMVSNTGFDGSGTHGSRQSAKPADGFSFDNKVTVFPSTIKENAKLFALTKTHLRHAGSFTQKIAHAIRKLVS